MSRIKQLGYVLVAIGFVWAVLRLSSMNSLAVLGQAPDVTIATTSGPVSLSSLKGKVVLVDVWGTWCGPCRESMPAIERLYKSRHSRGFEVMGMAMETDGGAHIPQVVKELGITYPVGLPAKSENPEAYQGESIPRMYLVDRRGRFRWTPVGYSSEMDADLEQRVDQLLAED